MVNFFYLDDYDAVAAENTERSGGTAVLAEAMYPVGDVAEGEGGKSTSRLTEELDLVQEHANGTASSSGSAILSTHAKMYSLGSKYNIPSLQAVALNKFENAAKSHLDKDDFAAATRVAFGTTPDTDNDLRALLMGVILDNMYELLRHAEFVNAINDIDGLVLELLKYQTAKRFAKRIAYRVCGTSMAKTCAGSSKRNAHSFVSCDCDSDSYCGRCPNPW